MWIMINLLEAVFSIEYNHIVKREFLHCISSFSKIRKTLLSFFVKFLYSLYDRGRVNNTYSLCWRDTISICWRWLDCENLDFHQCINCFSNTRRARNILISSTSVLIFIIDIYIRNFWIMPTYCEDAISSVH